MANSCCGKWDPTVTDNELVWKAIEYAEVKNVQWDASFRWSFGPNSAWGSIKSL